MKPSKEGSPTSKKAPSRLRAARRKAKHRKVRIILYQVERVKWKRALELALDAILEAESGELEMIARNLLEAATVMLLVASEIRGRVRQ